MIGASGFASEVTEYILDNNDYKIKGYFDINEDDYKKYNFEENDAAKGGYKNTETSIKEMINKLDFENIADYYISCDPTTTNGNLEHLILSTMDSTKKECVESFIKCVDGKEAHDNKKIVLTGYQAIFKEAPYNYDHANFEELKTKILELLK